MLLSLVACGSVSGPAPDPAGDSGSGRDTAAETGDPKIDTGVALVHFEGQASVSGGTWRGEESWIASSFAEEIEHCRVSNVMTGPASSSTCPTCTFSFEVTVGRGSMDGDRCDAVDFRADMWEGLSWIYAFAPSYVVYSGTGYPYFYENVLLYGYDAGGEMRWAVAAYAEQDEDLGLTYRSRYTYQWDLTTW